MKITLPGSLRTWLVVGGMMSLGWVLGFGGAHRFWSQETAAWVQALGSIGAVIGAWLLVSRQLTHERAMEDERRRLAQADAANKANKRDRDAIDAMMYAADMAARIAENFKDTPDPIALSDSIRFAKNAEALLAYHARRDREWSDLVLTLFSSQEQLRHVLDALRLSEMRSIAPDGVAKIALDAHRALGREIAYIEEDKPYEPFFDQYRPKQMREWPSWTK